ncbi:hypothetical protein P8452_08332 [Trifolium repens]|nr:hypothetical protein P8452_08332 [Trifolium repens]
MTTLKEGLSYSKPVIIRKVLAHNVEYEFELIREVVIDGYCFVSMDTEFPGVIYSPNIDRRHLQPSDFYGYFKANVDNLKLIQLGLTLSDVKGNLPDFGTDICTFGSSIFVILTSNTTFTTKIPLIFFDAKILTRNNLPNSLEEFLHVLRFLFGRSVYDMKHMIRYCNGLYGGLECVASSLNVGRTAGKSHQAASDSLLTWHAFQKMLPLYFSNNEAKNHAGVIFGLEVMSK